MKFTATIRKSGNSWIVTIPSDFVKYDFLKEGTKYDFVIIGKKNEE